VDRSTRGGVAAASIALVGLWLPVVLSSCAAPRGGGSSGSSGDEGPEPEQGIFLWSFHEGYEGDPATYNGFGFIDRTGEIRCDDLPGYYWYWEDESKDASWIHYGLFRGVDRAWEGEYGTWSTDLCGDLGADPYVYSWQSQAHCFTATGYGDDAGLQYYDGGDAVLTVESYSNAEVVIVIDGAGERIEAELTNCGEWTSPSGRSNTGAIRPDEVSDSDQGPARRQKRRGGWTLRFR